MQGPRSPALPPATEQGARQPAATDNQSSLDGPPPVPRIDVPQRPPTKAGDSGWILLTAMHAPDHVERTDDETDFAACAASDITHVSEIAREARNRMRASKGDALQVTQFGLQHQDSTYHWAHVTIISTKSSIVAKEPFMTGAERFWMDSVLRINEAIAERRRLALNPCVTMEANGEIYYQFMHLTENAQQ